MKILFFLALPNPFPGAGWTRVGHFAQTTKERGHDVKVVGSFLSYRLDKPSVVNWKGIPIYNICPVFGLDNMLTYIVDFVVSMFMVIPILFWRPDVIVISTPPCSPSLGTWLSAKLVDAKIVIDYRDFFITYKISTTKSKFDIKALKVYRRFMSILYQKSDLVVTVTDGTQKILKKLGVFSTVISNGADTEIFKPRTKYDREYVGVDINGVYHHHAVVLDKNTEKTYLDGTLIWESTGTLSIHKSDFVIVFVCGTISYYDMTPVLRAISLLEDLNIKIVVVGDFSSIPRKPWISNVNRTARELGIEDSLVFTGSVIDPSELAEIISTADVGIVPIEAGSLCAKTAYAVKLFEYCACGIPSIVTVNKNSLMGRLVNDHHIGIAVPYGDVIGLSNAIRKLYEDDGLRIVLGQNGRRMVEQNFDRIRNSDRFMRLVERM